MLRSTDFAFALSQADQPAQAVVDEALTICYANATFKSRFLSQSPQAASLIDIVGDIAELTAARRRIQRDHYPQTLRMYMTGLACVVECRRLIVDDHFYLRLTVMDAAQEQADGPANEYVPNLQPAVWETNFYLSAAMLRDVNVTSILINVVMQLQAPSQHQQRIYIVLAELYNNALEHGLLGLDSRLKTNAGGFAEYYNERSRRLAKLVSGFIRVTLQHQPVGDGGDLHIRVEDSGSGFDVESLMLDAMVTEQLSGRGSQIIRQLCDSFYYTHSGRVAHAIYHWIPQATIGLNKLKQVTPETGTSFAKSSVKYVTTEDEKWPRYSR